MNIWHTYICKYCMNVCKHKKLSVIWENFCKYEKYYANMRNRLQIWGKCLQISYLDGIANSSIPGFLQDCPYSTLCTQLIKTSTLYGDVQKPENKTQSRWPSTSQLNRTARIGSVHVVNVVYKLWYCEVNRPLIELKGFVWLQES